jgi:hypothetical protein
MESRKTAGSDRIVALVGQLLVAGGSFDMVKRAFSIFACEPRPGED